MAKVSDYMSSPVYVVRPEDTLAYARNLMLSKDIGRLVVVSSDMRPIGMITISDITSLVLRREEDLNEMLVRDVMSKDIVVVEETKTLKTAAYLMLRHKVGGLPVVDESGSLVGLITRTDVVRAFAERYKGAYKVGEISRKDVAVARRNHSISYVMKLIAADPAGKVVIVDEAMRPIGVIAKRDIAFIDPSGLARKGKESYRKYRAEAPGREEISLTREYLIPTVEEIMTPNPIVARVDEDAAEAAGIMLRKDIGCLPVVDGEKLVGILTKLEILAAISIG